MFIAIFKIHLNSAITYIFGMWKNARFPLHVRILATMNGAVAQVLKSKAMTVCLNKYSVPVSVI